MSGIVHPFDPLDPAVALVTEYERRIAILENAIRKHRDERGDDRCWMDDAVLYKTLPEGFTPPVRDSSVELKMCEQYIACRHNPATEYVSPQRKIEQLEAENYQLRESNSGHCDRIAKQSELLSRRAEKAS